MKKGFRYYAAAWAVLFVVFNVICFATPNEAAGMNKFGGAFWAGYIFITIAFLGQLFCAYLALNTEDNTRLFYNIPVIRISYIGLIVTIIVGAACMAMPNLPNWLGVIVCLLVLAVTAVSVIKAKAAADIVGNNDEKISAQTSFIKSLTADAKSLCILAKTEDAKAACQKVYEAVRYSDPKSSDALAEVESRIEQKFAKFSDAVKENDESAGSISEELAALIAERNIRCRASK